MNYIFSDVWCKAGSLLAINRDKYVMGILSKIRDMLRGKVYYGDMDTRHLVDIEGQRECGRGKGTKRDITWDQKELHKEITCEECKTALFVWRVGH